MITPRPANLFALLAALLAFVALSTPLPAAETAPLRTALLAWEPVPARPDVQRVAGDLVALAQAELSAEPGLAWVERAELEKLLAETDLAVSGRLDPRASLRVGKLARAQLLVSGRLDASDFAKTTLALDVIDLERGDLLATSVTALPPRPHKHFVLRDEDRAAAVTALRALLGKAAARQRELVEKPALALLFLANSGPSSRLDAAGERLASSLRDSAADAGARVLRFPRARDAEAEQELAILGLAEADDQAWRGVADLYVWGEYKELPADGLPFEQTPVEASLTLWDGASAPRAVPWRGTVATFPEASAAFAKSLAPSLRKTPAADPAARYTAAKRLADQAAALERGHSASLGSDDFWTSELGRNFQRHRLHLLQTSAFLRADDGAVRRSLFRAKWDSRPNPQALSIEALWERYADRRLVTGQYPDPRNNETYQRSLRISDLQAIIGRIGSDLRDDKRLRVPEARRAALLWVKEAKEFEAWVANRPGASSSLETVRRALGDYLVGLGNGPYIPSDLGLGIRREMLDGVWPIIAPAFRAWFDSEPAFGIGSARSYVSIYAAFGEEDAAYQRILAALSTPLAPQTAAAAPYADSKPPRSDEAPDRPPSQPEWRSEPPRPAPAALGPDLPLIPLTCYRWSDIPPFPGETVRKLERVGRLNERLLPSDTIRLLGYDGRRLWIDGILEPEAAVPSPPARRIALLAPDTREFTEIGARLPSDSRLAAAAFTRSDVWLATNFSGLLRINSSQSEAAQITPDAGLPSLKLGAIASYDGGLVVAASPETGLARFDSTASRWLNMTLPAETAPAPSAGPRPVRPDTRSEPTRVAGLGPWILVARSGLHLFDTRAGTWSEALAAHRAGAPQRRAEWLRQSADNGARLDKARERGDLAEIKKLTAAMAIPREWSSGTPAAILADEAAFWIGDNRGLVRYDPNRPVAEARIIDGPAVLALADAGPWLWVLFSPEEDAVGSSGRRADEPPESRRSRIALFDKRESRWRGSLAVVGGITSLTASPGRLWAAGSTLLEFNTVDVAPPEAGKKAGSAPADIAGAWLGLPASPLHAAVEAGDIALLKHLLAEGLPPSADGAEAWTPLHLAANRSDHAAVDVLLAAGADIHAFTRDGRDALGLAAARGDLKLVRRLLAAGADPRLQARPHTHALNGFDAALASPPKRPPAQPFASAVALLPDGRARVHWQSAPDAGNDGFVIYRLDTPGDPSGVGASHRWGFYSPQNRDLGQLVGTVRSTAREWIDEHPCAPGGSSAYTVVAVNASDRVGPPDPPSAGTVSAPARQPTQPAPSSFETHALDRDRTPLHLAAEAGHPDVVEALLAAGADPAAIDAGGRTALHLAATRGHSAVAERLIAARTPLDIVALGEAGLPERLFMARIHPGELGRAGAHTALSLVYFAHRDQSLFRRLLAAGANPARGPDGALAPLAASLGREEDMELLLAAGPHPFVANIYGQTVFTAALEAGRLQLARRLRERAFDPSHPAWPADPRLTQLAYYTAVRKSHLETIRWLRTRGATLSTATEGSDNPLQLAVEKQAPAAIVRELLEAGANPRRLDSKAESKIVDPEVRALLAGGKSSATSEGKATERIPFPLSQNPRSGSHGPIPENQWGDPRSRQAPAILRDRLHKAAAAGDLGEIRAAIAEGVWIDAPDAKGWTALFHALNGKQPDAARFLIDRGASLNRVTEFGSSPLCFAVGLGSAELVDEMLDLGADPNLFDSESGSPLTIALEKDAALARRLLARGADPRLLVEIQGYIDHVPALFVFARRGNLAAIKTLVAEGVDPKTRLWRGRWAEKPSHRLDALPFAAVSNDTATLDYFLGLGLNPAQEDAYGDNALDWALRCKADRTAAKLSSLGVKTRSERGLPPGEN